MNAAVVFLPLSIFTIISKTTPFWTAILGFFIMAEAILPIEIGGMMICFGAFLYITLVGGKASTDVTDPTGDEVSAAGRALGIFLIFTSAWLVAGLFVANRCLKGLDSWIIIFYHGFFGLIMSLVYFGFEVFFNEDHLFFTNYTPMQYFLTVIVVLVDAVSIYAGLKAAQSSNLGFVGLISYTQIIFAFIFDIFFFHEKLNVSDMLAVGVILLTTISVSIYKIK